VIVYSFIVQAAGPIRNWDQQPGCMINDVPTLKCLEVVTSNLLFMSALIFVVALLIMFIWGAFTYLTSFGNPEKVKKAQGIFRYAIIGLFLYLGSYLILKIIDTLFLGGQGTLFKIDIPG